MGVSSSEGGGGSCVGVGTSTLELPMGEIPTHHAIATTTMKWGIRNLDLYGPKGVRRRRVMLNVALAEPDRPSTRRSMVNNSSQARGRRQAFFRLELKHIMVD
jgi:hypothetical protein